MLDDLLKPVVAADVSILTVDIERLPGIAYAWEPKTRYIPASQFLRWPSLLCFAAKWYGQRRLIFHASWHDGGMEAMVKAAWDLYDRADIIVSYNGIRFDDKHLRSEWLQAGMSLPRPWKDVDLYAEVRRSFGFESKSLDQVCKRLGIPAKAGHYDMAQAEAAANGDVKAQRALERYNRNDVKITELAYDRMRGSLPGHPVLSGPVDDLTLRCNQCGSDDLEPNGTYRAVVQQRAAYRCRSCGANVSASHLKRISNVRGIR